MSKTKTNIAVIVPVAAAVAVAIVIAFLLTGEPAEPLPQRDETAAVTIEEEVPAYEEPIEDLGTAVEEAQENVEERLEEGESPFKADMSEPMAEDEEEYACDFGDWVGKTVAELDLEAIERPYRVLEPGSMYTTDFLPERINIHIDEEGTVVNVTCG